MMTLEVGPGTEGDGITRPGEVWSDTGEIETLDGAAGNNPTYVHDLRQELPEALVGRYDHVLASHVLEHIDRPHMGIAINNLVQACKAGGDICIIVPSLEWAAQQIVNGNNSIAIQGMLWGGQRLGNDWDVHYCGFTLAALTVIARSHKLVVKRTGTTAFEIISDGRKWRAMSNFILLYKEV